MRTYKMDMMPTKYPIDCILLVGGEGTRIRHLLPEGAPKIMADINGTPFLAILADHLLRCGFNKLILATGYGHDALYQCTMDTTLMSRVEFSMETKPLGTAGAIHKAASLIKSEDFLIVNGDTFCDIDYKAMLAYHEATNSTITVACDREFKHVGTFIATKKFVDLIPKSDSKVDMAEIFMLLGQRHEPVGWFMTDVPFYDIGSPEDLTIFRNYQAQLSKGGEGRMIGSHEDTL